MSVLEATTHKKTLKVADTTDIPEVIFKFGDHAYSYNTALTLAGKKIDVRRYSTTQLKYLPRKKTIKAMSVRKKHNFIDRILRQATYKRRTDNIHRSKNRVISLIHANFPIAYAQHIPTHVPQPRWYLLTYNDPTRAHVKNHKIQMQDVARFQRRLKKYAPNLMYIGVSEKMENGRVHFHFLLFNRIKYLKKNVLEDMWGQGFVKIKTVEDVTGQNKGYTALKHIAHYMGKYIQKEADDRKIFQNSYFVSQNLKQPITSYGETILSILKKAINEGYVIEKRNKVYSTVYGGYVTYETWEPG